MVASLDLENGKKLLRFGFQKRKSYSWIWNSNCYPLFWKFPNLIRKNGRFSNTATLNFSTLNRTFAIFIKSISRIRTTERPTNERFRFAFAGISASRLFGEIRRRFDQQRNPLRRAAQRSAEFARVRVLVGRIDAVDAKRTAPIQERVRLRQRLFARSFPRWQRVRTKNNSVTYLSEKNLTSTNQVV